MRAIRLSIIHARCIALKEMNLKEEKMEMKTVKRKRRRS